MEKRKKYQRKKSMEDLVRFLYGTWGIFRALINTEFLFFLCLPGFLLFLSLFLEYLYSILCLDVLFRCILLFLFFSFPLSDARICDALISGVDAPDDNVL